MGAPSPVNHAWPRTHVVAERQTAGRAFRRFARSTIPPGGPGSPRSSTIGWESRPRRRSRHRARDRSPLHMPSCPRAAPRDSKSASTRVHSPYLKGVYARLRGLWTGVNALNDAPCVAGIPLRDPYSRGGAYGCPRSRGRQYCELRVVEPRGVEPLTSSLRTRRSPN